MCLCFSLTNPILEDFTNSDISAAMHTNRSTDMSRLMQGEPFRDSHGYRRPRVCPLRKHLVGTAAIEAVKEIIWMKEFTKELGI